MKELEKLILEKGKVLEGNILKVDSFLNQQIDISMMKKMGIEFANHFRDKNIDRILTVESSGIAPAVFAAEELNCKCVFARKQKSLTLDDNIFHSTVYSFTKQVMKEIIVSKEYLKENENVLLIDDFLANGQACKGMIALCNQAGANVSGIGIVIEKSFQDGRKLLKEEGYDVFSLAKIKEFKDGKVIFEED